MNEHDRQFKKNIEHLFNMDWENENILNAVIEGLAINPYEDFSIDQLKEKIKNERLKDNISAILDRLVESKILGYEPETKTYWLTTEGYLFWTDYKES